MSRKYEDTIDWNLYWEHEIPDSKMVKGATNMAKRIAIFIDKYDPQNIADFGCGPGITLFILANRYPHIEFTGFDSSIPIIKKNRLKANDMKLDNVQFDCEKLPVIKTEDKFDLIYSIATLYYVKNDDLLCNLKVAVSPQLYWAN